MMKSLRLCHVGLPALVRKQAAHPRKYYITLLGELQASRSSSDLIFKQQHSIRFITTTPNKMSFSNTSTGDAPADPYKKANAEEVPLQTKIEDLVNFITKEKFGMMTTRGSGSGNLVSRCMALAATVRWPYTSLLSVHVI